MSEQPTQTSDALPRPFGPYLLLSRLARGGMGEVYLAKTGGLQGFEKHCVVKTLRPEFADEPEYLTRFSEEARVVVQLSHRNVCSVFDVGRVDGQLYLAMDLVVGCDLRTVVARGSLPTALGIYIISEVLEALDYAHRFVDGATNAPLGLAHRDVSPQNVLISDEGDVKLIDFGIATTTRVGPMLAPGVVLGKTSYMSPEHARGHHTDGRSDQYAAAVILVTLMTGQGFYEGVPRDQVPLLVGAGGYRPPAFEELDAELRAILDRALSPEPSRRFDSASAFGAAVVGWARSRGMVADARDLRRHMQRHFPDIAVQQRQRARAFADAHVPALGPLGPASGFETIATTLIVGPNTLSISEPAATVVVRERHHQVATTPNPVPPSRVGVAVLASVVLLGVGAFVLRQLARDPEPLPLRTGAGASAAAAPVAPPPLVVPVAVVAPDAGAEAAAPATATVDAGIPAPTPAATVSTGPVTTAAKPAPKPAALRPSTKLSPELRQEIASITSNAECMKRLACARGLTDWTHRDLSSDALRVQFTELASDCAKQCRLLR